MKRQFIIAAAGFAAWLVAASAHADSSLVEGITPTVSIGFNFGEARAPSAVSRFTAAFNVNSRVVRPTLARMGSPSADVEEDIQLAGRGMPILTVLDFSSTERGVDAAHALGRDLVRRK